MKLIKKNFNLLTSEFPWKTLKLLTAIAVGVADEKEVKCRFSNGKHLERDLTINTGERILFQNYLFAAFTTRKILLSSSEKHIHLSVGGKRHRTADVRNSRRY